MGKYLTIIFLFLCLTCMGQDVSKSKLIQKNCSHWDRYLGQMPRTPSTCPHDYKGVMCRKEFRIE